MGRKKDLNVVSLEVNNMEVRKVIMKNGNEYFLLWDVGLVEEPFLRMIDLRKGWVKLNMDMISEMYSVGKLKDRKGVNPLVKKEIKEYYSGEVFLE